MSCHTNAIHVELSSVRSAPRAPVHLMPCEVEHSGPARVSQYFHAVIKDCKQGTHTHAYIQVIFVHSAQPPACAFVVTEKTASFRGRGLRGQELCCPEGHTGLVLKETHQPGSDQEVHYLLKNISVMPPLITYDTTCNDVCAGILAQDRTVKVTSVFDKMTYWNRETPPTSDDRVVMAMDWPELAEAVSRCFITSI